MTQLEPLPAPSAVRIFVSHSHKDHEFCARLVDVLRRDFGEDAVWYDKLGGLAVGDEWWTKIRTELRTRPIFIPVLSPDAIESRWVNDELTLAWTQRNQPEGKTIIPVLFRPCSIRDDINTLKNKVSFVAPRSFEAAYAQLTKQLRDFEAHAQAKERATLIAWMATRRT
jgi:hypothetical protein